MGSILDSILGGDIPNLDALRAMGPPLDDSYAGRQETIDKTLQALDETADKIEGDDIDARALRLLIQGAKFIMRASHEDILNAASDGPPDQPRLAETVRHMLSEAMKGAMGMTDQIDQIADMRSNAVAGFKAGIATPSYAEQRLREGVRVEYCGQGDGGSPGTLVAISDIEVEARHSIMSPPVYKVEWDDTLPNEDASSDWYVESELRVLDAPAT